uniref:Uncharacterized protein n=1 Tax=Anopheles dirus TaxID=7168 RepID=A0A182NPQ5_9DIPT
MASHCHWKGTVFSNLLHIVYLHLHLALDDEDKRYKNFMNAIKRKRLQHLKEQLQLHQQPELVSNQQ